MKAGTEEDPGWRVLLFTESQNVPKNKRKEWKVKKTSVGKKCPLKNVALAVKM